MMINLEGLSQAHMLRQKIDALLRLCLSLGDCERCAAMTIGAIIELGAVGKKLHFAGANMAHVYVLVGGNMSPNFAVYEPRATDSAAAGVSDHLDFSNAEKTYDTATADIGMLAVFVAHKLARFVFNLTAAVEFTVDPKARDGPATVGG
jgi:hypothetical protein